MTLLAGFPWDEVEPFEAGAWTSMGLPDGREVSVRMYPDPDGGDIWSNHDLWGRVAWDTGRWGGDRLVQRPNGMDGRAVVVSRDRGTRLWLQPPEDVSDEHMAAHVDRVRAYFRDEWWFCTLEVRTKSAPCACCGECKTNTEYLGGIESDCGPEYLAELAEGMVTTW